ncbi:hypothetical protein [Geminicoccus roseus]|uniref:hypothetical protein n=1 Tax=Geminicoccus roseus TaxID=404900 RepID=UPI0012FC2601|nr:hypothetical protein [Geminicoccus roseus]
MHPKRRAALTLMLARDSLLSCHRLARHIVEEIDGVGAKQWGQAYARRIELFESLMRCLIDYGVRPTDLQNKLKTVPTEEKVPVNLASVLEAEGRLERHLGFSLRAGIEDPELARLLARAFEEVRHFRAALELESVAAAPAGRDYAPVSVDKCPEFAGAVLH